MIVAVIAMRMVEMAQHEVIDVTVVRDGFVSATAPVDVPLVMPDARVARRTDRRIHSACLQRVLIHMVLMGMMQVTIM